jgi:hypothetical protein
LLCISLTTRSRFVRPICRIWCTSVVRQVSQKLRSQLSSTTVINRRVLLALNNVIK